MNLNGFSKKWIVIIFTISITAILLSSSAVPAFAEHTFPENRGKAAYFFDCSGFGGGQIGSEVQNRVFFAANNGVYHGCGYNWINQAYDAINNRINVHLTDTFNGQPVNHAQFPDLASGNPLGWLKIQEQFLTTFGINGVGGTIPELHPSFNTKLILRGYSYGGAAAAYASHDESVGIFTTFDLIQLKDPVGPLGFRANVVKNCPAEQTVVCLPGFFGDKEFFTNVKFMSAWFQDNGFPPIDPHATAGFQSPHKIPFIQHDCSDQIIFGIPAPNANCDRPNVINRPMHPGDHFAVGGDSTGEIYDEQLGIMERMNVKPFLEFFPSGINLQEGQLQHNDLRSADQMAHPVHYFTKVTEPPAEVEEILNIIYACGVFPGSSFWEDFGSSKLKHTTPANPEGLGTAIKEITSGSSSKSFQGCQFDNSLLFHGAFWTAGLDDGNYNLRVQVEDNGFPCDECLGSNIAAAHGSLGKWHERIIPVTVTDVPSKPEISFDPIINAQDDHPFVLTATDDGFLDQEGAFSYKVNWGDGSAEETLTESESLVQNGSFEVGTEPGFFTPTNSGPLSEAITDWEVTSDSIDYVGWLWFGYKSARSLDMSGNEAGSISQTFPTEPGSEYQVRFYMAGNPTCGPNVKGLNVAVANVSEDFAFNISGKSTTNMGWEQKKFYFTAIDPSTTLTFTSTTPGVCGAALDTVDVKKVLSVNHQYDDMGEYDIIVMATDEDGVSSSITEHVMVDESVKPMLSLPDDIVAEATSADGAIVEYEATASSRIDPNVTADCVPASGSLFPLGITIVTCSATDVDGNTSGEQTFTITVQDTIPPEITPPDDIVFEANSVEGGIGIPLGDPTVSDLVDSDPDVSNDAVEPFPLGITEVSWTATDAAGNSASATQFVVVEDTTPPEVTDPPDVTTESTGSTTPVDIGTGTATDIFEIVDIFSDAPDEFEVGITEVHWFAQDENGNLGSTETQLVTITDTVPPELTVPSDATIDAVDPFGSTHTFSASATDIADPDPIVECLPPSDSLFPLGTTTVTCTATDVSGNQSSDSFDVTVQVSAVTFDGFVDKVESMELQKGIENSLISKIDAAAKSFDKGKTKTVINQLEALVNEVNALKGKKITENQTNDLLDCADLLIDALSGTGNNELSLSIETTKAKATTSSDPSESEEEKQSDEPQMVERSSCERMSSMLKNMGYTQKEIDLILAGICG